MNRPGPTLAPVRDEPCVGQDISVGHPRCPVQFQPCDEVRGGRPTDPSGSVISESPMYTHRPRLHCRRKPKRFDLVTRPHEIDHGRNGLGISPPRRIHLTMDRNPPLDTEREEPERLGEFFVTVRPRWGLLGSTANQSARRQPCNPERQPSPLSDPLLTVAAALARSPSPRQRRYSASRGRRPFDSSEKARSPLAAGPVASKSVGQSSPTW